MIRQKSIGTRPGGGTIGTAPLISVVGRLAYWAGPVAEGRRRLCRDWSSSDRLVDSAAKGNLVQAEGWHSGLNSRFGVPHPSLRLFLDWLQKCQFAV